VFDIGTAGSATLVLQTILPALLLADAESHVEIIGGTHNPLAPPFDFFERAFVPALRKLGANVSVAIRRHGFYPAGGGRISCEVVPAPLRRIELFERGPLRGLSARALLSKLPRHIAERELEIVQRRLDLDPTQLRVVELDAASPGNALVIDVQHAEIDEVFAGIGQRGIRAETVADSAAREARDYLEAGVAIGPHLCDQLLLPMALAGGGAFSTLEPTLHTRTNAQVIQRMLPVSIELSGDGDRWTVRVAEGPSEH
jgi:RNA 3'-terminal phosphate cyclase (ATP)